MCCVYLTALYSYMISYHAGAGARCWHGTRRRELRLLPSVGHIRLSHSAEMISSSRRVTVDIFASTLIAHRHNEGRETGRRAMDGPLVNLVTPIAQEERPGIGAACI